MTGIAEVMPLLARHAGRWLGTYTHCGLRHDVLDRHDFAIDVSFPDPCTYRQDSHYAWPDGRRQTLTFEGVLENEAIVFNNGRIAGRIWALDAETLYLTFRFSAEPVVHVCEMIQLSANGRDRARTWHWFRNGKLYQRTLVEERRGD